MRIAFVPAARLLSDREPNGESLIALDLLRALADRGHELLVYCERAELERPVPGAEIVEISAAGRTGALGRLAFSDRIGRDLATRHAQRRIDVAHLIFPCTSTEGYAPTLPAGVPLIVGPLNGSWPRAVASSPRLAARAASLLTSAVEQRRHRATLQTAKAVLVATSDAMRALPPGPRDRAVDCPFGVDATRFSPEPLPAEPVIGVCSILSPRKGLDQLIRALPAIRTRIPRASLRIAGPDPLGVRTELQALAEAEGVADAVTFLGGIAPNAIEAFYAGCRLVVQPSIGEPFGMSILEAMSCGRPVVAIGQGGPLDTVLDQRTGRLVVPGSVKALADAIVAVLCEPRGAERLGSAGRARIEQRFDLARIVDTIEASYRDAAQEHAHAS